MPILRRFTLRARFHLLMGVVGGALLALTAWGVLSNQASVARASALFDQAGAGAAGVARLRESLGEVRRLEASLIAVGTSNTLEVERLAGLWKAETNRAKGAADALVSGDPDNPGLAKRVAAQHALLADYAAAIGPIAEQLQAARIDGPVALA